MSEYISFDLLCYLVSICEYEMKFFTCKAKDTIRTFAPDFPPELERATAVDPSSKLPSRLGVIVRRPEFGDKTSGDPRW